MLVANTCDISGLLGKCAIDRATIRLTSAAQTSGLLLPALINPSLPITYLKQTVIRDVPLNLYRVPFCQIYMKCPINTM